MEWTTELTYQLETMEWTTYQNMSKKDPQYAPNTCKITLNSQWHNNLSYFSLKMWNKVFTYLEFHKNTSYLGQQTGQLKKLASLCTILSKTTLTVSVFVYIFTNLSEVSLILGTMAPWTLTGSGYCLTSMDKSLIP